MDVYVQYDHTKTYLPLFPPPSVPAEVTVRLLREAMERSGSSKFLVDGFPRDLQNLGVCIFMFIYLHY
ncbi:hypothetical protein EON63_15390 [archaeon]|nr:MAG: hypothetical protein EON63_15390 [archaeon]